MHFTELPTPLRTAIDAELVCLNETIEYDIPSENRIHIYQLIGSSCHQSYREKRLQSEDWEMPALTKADRVRTQVALATARKVLPLWDIACKETEAHFTDFDWQCKAEDESKEEAYLQMLSDGLIEQMCVFTEIPRKFVPSHLLRMAEIAFAGQIRDVEAFTKQASDWWISYGSSFAFCEREASIKWAVHEALHEALAWTSHWPDCPAQDAARAYAGEFFGETFETRQMQWNYAKRNEFWRWWLTEAIPTAWELEYKTQ